MKVPERTDITVKEPVLQLVVVVVVVRAGVRRARRGMRVVRKVIFVVLRVELG